MGIVMVESRDANKWYEGNYDYNVCPYMNLEKDFDRLVQYHNSQDAYFLYPAGTRLEAIPSTLAGDYVGNTVYRANALALLDSLYDKARTANADTGRFEVKGIYVHTEGRGDLVVLHDSAISSEKTKEILASYCEKIADYPSYNDDYLSRVEYQIFEEHIQKCFSMDEREKFNALGTATRMTPMDLLDDLQIQHHVENSGLSYYIGHDMAESVNKALAERGMLDADGDLKQFSQKAPVKGHKPEVNER